MWHLDRLVLGHKTIADRKENGAALHQVCTRFMALCRQVVPLPGGTVMSRAPVG